MTSESALQMAIAIITKATKEDNDKNYESALRLYVQGVDYFLHAIKHEAQGEKAKEAIRAKSLEYVDRAEKIKSILSTDINKAIEIITKATEADRNNDHKKAIELYEQGVADFMHVIKYHVQGEEAKECIRAKCKLYTDRAEEIKKSLMTLLKTAIEIVTEATEEDRNHNYKNALQLYEEAVEKFMHVMNNYAQSEKAKESIRSKCKLYTDRIEIIKNSFNKFNSAAIGNIINAIEEDRNLNYREAIESYKEGAENISLAIKYQIQEGKEKEKLEAKRLHYLNRAETIEELIGNESSTIIGTLQTKIKQLNLEEDVGVDKIPQMTWLNVVGLDVAKNLLKESVILPIKYSQLFLDKKNSWKGILLFGPPGTGKSILGNAVLNEISSSHGYFKCIMYMDQILDINEPEKLIKAVFETALLNKLCIIFIDKVDLLCSSNLDEHAELIQRARNEFLVQIQGVKSEANEILILGATNKPWMLDADILQHFEKRIYIPLPDENDRLDIFKLHLSKVPSELTEDDMKNLSKVTNGYSGEDIHNVVNAALLQSIHKIQIATHFKMHIGQSPINPSIIVNDLLTPCDPDDQGAYKMSFWDIDSDKLFKPPVTMSNMLNLLATSNLTSSKEDLEKFKKVKEDWKYDN